MAEAQPFWERAEQRLQRELGDAESHEILWECCSTIPLSTITISARTPEGRGCSACVCSAGFCGTNFKRCPQAFTHSPIPRLSSSARPDPDLLPLTSPRN